MRVSLCALGYSAHVLSEYQFRKQVSYFLDWLSMNKPTRRMAAYSLTSLHSGANEADIARVSNT